MNRFCLALLAMGLAPGCQDIDPATRAALANASAELGISLATRKTGQYQAFTILLYEASKIENPLQRKEAIEEALEVLNKPVPTGFE